MCVVSYVSDYYTQPNRFPTSPFQADPEAAKLLRQAIEILERIDKRLNDRECNDPAKAKFLKALDEYAAGLPPKEFVSPPQQVDFLFGEPPQVSETATDPLKGLHGTNLGWTP